MMKKLYQFLLLATLAIVPAMQLAAQDDPFGKEESGASAPTKKLDKTRVEKDPLILSVREKNPSTPTELIASAEIVLNYGRADEAKKYLQQILSSAPSDVALAELQERFGSAFFFRIIREKELAPEGTTLGDAVLNAAYKAVRDPVRLEKLVRQLSDSEFGTRNAAFNKLKQAETDAVAPLVRVLKDPLRKSEHALVRTALVTLGKQTVEPLIGALETSDKALRTELIKVLGRLKSQRALPFLIRPALSTENNKLQQLAATAAIVKIIETVPAKYDAQRYLYRQTKAYLAGQLPAASDLQGNIVLWHWDNKRGASVPRSYLAEDAALVTAARIGAELVALTPNNATYRRIYLTTLLESAKLTGGLDKALARGKETPYAITAAAGKDAVADMLSHAMRSDHVGAAIGAVEVLGDIGSAKDLSSEAGRVQPLAQALRSNDRRLQMAAVEAILKLDPQQAFPGCSKLSAALGYMARSNGTPRLLVAHPRREKARNLAGLFNEAGYTADTAQTGRQAYKLAAATPDCEMILLSDSLQHPRTSELVQWLRREPRTAKLPIGLMARAGHLEEAKRLAEVDPLTVAFSRPHTVPHAKDELDNLLRLVGRHHVAHPERIRQAATALERMATLLKRPDVYSFYNLHQQQDAVATAIYTPQLTVSAAKVLGLLATADSQKTLVEVASENGRPIKIRQAAASAFAVSVKRRGVLLKRAEILLQYDRQNLSEKLDAETQAVLGSILDAIEAPTKQKKVTFIKDEK